MRQRREVAALAAVALLATLLLFGTRENTRAPSAGANEPRRSTDLGALTLPPGASPRSGDAVIAPPPEAFTDPPAAAPPPPHALRERFRDVVPEGGTWAVLVGINDYPGGRHDLRSAINDVTDVNEALARMGVPASRRLWLRDGQATAELIRTAVEWLLAHASPDATVVFFYAGHVRKVGGQEAIVAADGQLVRDHELGEQFSRLRARRAWFGIAACYGGGFTELMGPNRVLTAAASADRLAYENLDFGRSYMVEYMVRRGWLEQQAGITVEEAFDYARRELASQHPGRVPVQIDSVEGLLDLRPFGAPPPVPARPAPPPPPPSPPPTSQPPPPDSGGGANTSGGGDSSGNRGDGDDSDDSCSTLTGGVISCGG